MDTLNQIELQDLRHICGATTGFCIKIEYYKTLVNDSTGTDILTKLCTTCNSIKQDLTSLI
ncbi:MAG: hypothetical protein IKL08_06720 [Clostridia bacterium]|nr:hypothetical protein [Clostridia bacterium]